MIRGIYRVLISLRFTLALILLLSLLFLLGLWIPQKNLLTRELYLDWKNSSPGLVSVLEALDLTDIHASPLMLTLWAVFFLNLALVMARRVPIVKKKVQEAGNRIADPALLAAYPVRSTIVLPDARRGQCLA